MRIVHLVDYLMPTMGYQEFLLPKWNKFQGCDVTIITSDRYQPVPNYENTWKKFLGQRIIGPGKEIKDGVEIIRLPVNFEIKGRPWMVGLQSALKQINPDLLYCHGTGSFSLYRSHNFAKKRQIPLVADNHMILDIVQEGIFQSIYYFFHKFFLKKIQTGVYKFIGVTEESSDYLKAKEGINADKITTIHLGVDINVFKPTKPDLDLKSKYQKNKSTFVVMQSGKLNNDKKPQWLADAVIKLLLQGKDISLVYIGSGDDVIENEINSKFSEIKEEDRVFFEGMKDLTTLSTYFSSLDLVVFPDGTSLSALEVAACGGAVIMADHPASRDRESNGLGITYETGNIQDLATKIDQLSDEETRKTLIGNSIESVHKNYSYEKISLDTIELYKKAIQDGN